MNNSVVYLISGKPHLPYLVTSLYSLRRYWDGPVTVYAWPESIDIVREIGEDSRLFIACRERKPKYRRRDGVRGNAQFIDKIDLMRSLDVDVGLYLDSDTLVKGDVTSLIERAQEFGFCATQFNNWLSSNGKPRKRISRLLGRVEINQESVQRVLSSTVMPSVNGGVFACRSNSPVLPVWYACTLAVKDIFIADETVLHVLLAEFENTGHLVVARGGSFNAAPKFNKLPDKEIKIWHGHGDSFVRPNKSQKAVDMWWPMYKDCLARNIGGMQGWIDQVGNKYLSMLEGWNKPIPCID